jgi:hypothetical protein
MLKVPPGQLRDFARFVAARLDCENRSCYEGDLYGRISHFEAA